jgi:hypothetical protein
LFLFHMILGVNRNYFLNQHRQIDLCNGEVLCSLWVTDLILNIIYTSFGFSLLNNLANIVPLLKLYTLHLLH